MEDKEFREALTGLIENNASLDDVRELFDKEKPQDFNINRVTENERISQNHTNPLMLSLRYINRELFKYLVEEQGADIHKCITAQDLAIDGQNLPVNFHNNHLTYTYTPGRSNENIEETIIGGRDNPVVQKKLQEAHQILDYIDKKLTTKQKNDIQLPNLASYFMDKTLLNKLIKNPDIDFNTTGARGETPLWVSTFVKGGVRESVAEKILEREDLIVTAEALTSAVTNLSPKIVEKMLKKVNPEDLDTFVMAALKKILHNDVPKETLALLVDKSPKSVEEFLTSEDYEIETRRLMINSKSLTSLTSLLNINELKLKQTAEKIDKLAESLSRESAGSNEINDKKVKTFYQDVVSILVKDKYITHEEGNHIKSSKSLDHHAKLTGQKLWHSKTKHGNINTKDYILSKTSDFCKKLGLTRLNNSLKNFISSEGKERLDQYEQGVKDSLAIKEIFDRNNIDSSKSRRIDLLNNKIQKKNISPNKSF